MNILKQIKENSSEQTRIKLRASFATKPLLICSGDADAKRFDHCPKKNANHTDFKEFAIEAAKTEKIWQIKRKNINEYQQPSETIERKNN